MTQHGGAIETYATTIAYSGGMALLSIGDERYTLTRTDCMFHLSSGARLDSMNEGSGAVHKATIRNHREVEMDGFKRFFYYESTQGGEIALTRINAAEDDPSLPDNAVYCTGEELMDWGVVDIAFPTVSDLCDKLYKSAESNTLMHDPRITRFFAVSEMIEKKLHEVPQQKIRDQNIDRLRKRYRLQLMRESVRK